MAFANRTLSLFVVLVVLLATLAASKPIPELDKRAVLTLLPQPSAWAIQTTQTASWSCPQCHPTGTKTLFY